MSSDPLVQEISRDASWLVQAYDNSSRSVRLLQLSADGYREASFLDDRVLHGDLDARYVPWATVRDAEQAMDRTDARWIFHIGHVGSTLIARLLGELPNVLSVREPRFLRDIAVLDGREPLTAASRKLFSRTFAPDQTALVKATSFVSEIASELMPDNGGALFMYASARRYIASILAGDASRQELRALMESRRQRAAGRVPRLAGEGESEAHMAAAAWACEMTALEAAARSTGDRNILWVDFDEALASLPQALHDMSRFFAFGASTEQIDQIASGPLTRRYSKALEYDYSSDLRRDVIAEAARMHRRDIGEALAMLEDAAQDSPLLARALSRSNSEA